MSDLELGSIFWAEFKERPPEELGEGRLWHQDEKSQGKVERSHWSLDYKTLEYITEKGS